MTELPNLIGSFIGKRRRPKDIGSFFRSGRDHDRDRDKKRRRRRRRHPRQRTKRRERGQRPPKRRQTQIIGDIRGLHVEIHPIEGVIFRNGRSRLFQVRNDGTITTGEGTSSIPLTEDQAANEVYAGPASGADAAPGFRALVDADIPAAIARDSEVTSEIGTHAADADAHHNWPLLESDIPAAIARDSEVTSEIGTHAADDNAHHDPVSLAADAAAFLGLSGQQLTVDAQAANTVLAGPTGGGGADPDFRALVDADIPAAIARDSEVDADIATHAGDADAHHTYPVPTAGIADDAVDDTKVGDRVPQFYRRQGSNATQWEEGGTTTYTPGSVRMQAGVINVGNITGTSQNVSITFPQAFSANPIIFLSPGTFDPSNAMFLCNWDTQNVGTTSFTFEIARVVGSTTEDAYVSWLAIGPE